MPAIAARAARRADRDASAIDDYVLWYYTPMALAFTDHLEPRAIVYDCMDELSAFEGAPAALHEREAELLRRADAGVHRRPVALRSEARISTATSIRSRAASTSRTSRRRARSRSIPPDQAAIPQPRLGFFGVIDERMDLDAARRRRRRAARLAARHARPGREDRSGDAAARAEHPLPRLEDVRRAAAIHRRLGRRAAAVRAQRGDAVHQPDEDARSTWRPASRSSRPRSATSSARTASRAWCGSPTTCRRSSRACDAALAEDRGARDSRSADAFLRADVVGRHVEPHPRLLIDALRGRRRRRADAAPTARPPSVERQREPCSTIWSSAPASPARRSPSASRRTPARRC